ncbi:MAG TPA: peptidoglycan-binding protein [Segeticoccus sp.]|nr:peptidoglycan-binding protein [Segeticoccus sp.]
MLPTLRVSSPALRATLAASASLATAVAIAPAAGAAPSAPSSAAGMPAAARVPVPTRPAGLPRAIEGWPAYVQNNSCDLEEKPGTAALRRLLLQTYPSTYITSTTRTCGTDTMVSYSEHYDGRSVDWGVSVRNSSKKYGDAFVNWLVGRDAQGVPGGNARRLGVMYLIWNNRQWWGWAPQKGWFDYNGCTRGAGNDTTCHRDHVHITLSWEGAMRHTSWWTKRVGAQDFGPCRPADLNWSSGYQRFNGTRCGSYPRVAAAAGSTGLHQSLVRFSGITVRQGMYGPVVRAIQQLVGAGVDGDFGPGTKAAVARWQAGQGLKGDGVVGYRTWRAALAVTEPDLDLSAYYKTVLRLWSSNRTAVKVLQAELNRSGADLEVDGAFGPGTEAAVNTFKAAHGLNPNGLVGRGTWKALEREANGTTSGPGTTSTSGTSASGTTNPPATTSAPKYAKYYRTKLHYGDRKPAVRVLKRALGQKSRSTTFGKTTRKKVNQLKRRNGLSANGVANGGVWHILGQDYSPWERRTLRYGSTGRYVKVLQNALGGLQPDGAFGRATRAKVNQVKRAHDLRVDGVAGRRTWQALSAG